ncbi:hypothetical protein [uncultured Maricaulis sp.]|mgnify:FL=1|uniref:hypothetical protein n=1 Tax=uncultured Maricaulis sp. TaxID=174710 RepID=UPI0030DC8919|tara:strand:+ start:1725 stop:2963 length:1239 start_codon:yes stop_codon:yes gene_type:complete
MVWLVGFGGFTLVVDPYEIAPWISIAGVNARRTRAHEDGYRVHVGHRLLTGEAGTITLGSSRVMDGFPRDLPDWPGGYENLAMAGTSAFELARASALAARNDAINCVVIGVDLREFSTDTNTQATYWITPMAGGSQIAALAKMALSPSAFARALQTVDDNRTGGSDERWEQAYAEAGLPARFEEELAKRYRYYASFEYDPERVAFLFRGIDALLASGKQIVVFIHPVHAWYEEARQRAGAGPAEIALRRDIAAQIAARGVTPEANQACFDGPALQAWDFGGFSAPARTAPPAADGSAPSPWYYVPSHYRPALGQAILDRLAGHSDVGQVGEDFGRRLTPDTLEAALDAFQAGREAWLQSQTPWEVHAAQAFDGFDANPPEPEAGPRAFLTRTDHVDLERDVRRIEDEHSAAR